MYLLHIQNKYYRENYALVQEFTVIWCILKDKKFRLDVKCERIRGNSFPQGKKNAQCTYAENTFLLF